jgi:hypothetical protein
MGLMSETFQLLRVENAIIAAGIKHLVLHHPAHIGRLVWCRVLQPSKQDAREYDREHKRHHFHFNWRPLLLEGAGITRTLRRIALRP